MNACTRIDHIGIMVADLEAALRFYTETLRAGRPARSRRASSRPSGAAACASASAELELIEARDPEQTMMRLLPHRGPGIYHLGLRVDDVDAEAAAPARRRRSAGRRRARRRRHAHPVPASRRRAGHDDRAGHPQSEAEPAIRRRGLTFRLSSPMAAPGEQEANDARRAQETWEDRGDDQHPAARRGGGRQAARDVLRRGDASTFPSRSGTAARSSRCACAASR